MSVATGGLAEEELEKGRDINEVIAEVSLKSKMEEIKGKTAAQIEADSDIYMEWDSCDQAYLATSLYAEIM